MTKGKVKNLNERKSWEYSCGCSRGLQQSDSIQILSNRPIGELMHSHKSKYKCKSKSKSKFRYKYKRQMPNAHSHTKWNLKFKTIKLSEEKLKLVCLGFENLTLLCSFLRKRYIHICKKRITNINIFQSVGRSDRKSCFPHQRYIFHWFPIQTSSCGLELRLHTNSRFEVDFQKSFALNFTIVCKPIFCERKELMY